MIRVVPRLPRFMAQATEYQSISTAAQKIYPKSQIPKFRIWTRKCFPPHPIPKQSFPNLGFGSDSDPNEYFFGQETCRNCALGKLLVQTCPKLVPTNINDFKHSINRPSTRPREQDRSRLARVLLAPCSRAVRARSASRFAWLPPSVALRAVVPCSVLPPSVLPRSVLTK
jgi:hypothetical protein